MKDMKWGVICAAMAVAATFAVVLLATACRREAVLETAPAAAGSVGITVTASGRVRPVEVVLVGTQVSGVIEKIYADHNSRVKAGQLLAELDKSTLLQKLTQAKASQTSAEADLVYARQNFNRIKHLHDNRAATDVSFEEAVKLLAQAETALANAKASTGQAAVNLKYAYIYSPIDGVVLERAVNVGQTVAASFSTPTLFTIAEDLALMQVEAAVDEKHIGRILTGLEADFTVDAYPGEIFAGTVRQVRLQPAITDNVVVYTVIVETANPGGKLFPGMTAGISIPVESEAGLVIPLAALDFRMTPGVARRLHADMPDADGRHIVWVKNDGGVQPRTVETGIDDGVNVIVGSGLREGEEVVLSAELRRR